MVKVLQDTIKQVDFHLSSHDIIRDLESGISVEKTYRGEEVSDPGSCQRSNRQYEGRLYNCVPNGFATS